MCPGTATPREEREKRSAEITLQGRQRGDRFGLTGMQAMAGEPDGDEPELEVSQFRDMSLSGSVSSVVSVVSEDSAAPGRRSQLLEDGQLLAVDATSGETAARDAQLKFKSAALATRAVVQKGVWVMGALAAVEDLEQDVSGVGRASVAAILDRLETRDRLHELSVSSPDSLGLIGVSKSESGPPSWHPRWSSALGMSVLGGSAAEQELRGELRACRLTVLQSRAHASGLIPPAELDVAMNSVSPKDALIDLLMGVSLKIVTIFENERCGGISDALLQRNPEEAEYLLRAERTHTIQNWKWSPDFQPRDPF
jgi:hypothetical protein